ncbi:hypothetical protein Glove_33g10 [Diversispora epigaea]|uniref:Uncharacterized protein n=1 Tax=Diversispora epigaea TaxID=1348612 RepID=A0A397JQX2_9GLOM|nr:hypothetical protein Glove_33g10 [Diversispora epigaea]
MKDNVRICHPGWYHNPRDMRNPRTAFPVAFVPPQIVGIPFYIEIYSKKQKCSTAALPRDSMVKRIQGLFI